MGLRTGPIKIAILGFLSIYPQNGANSTIADSSPKLAFWVSFELEIGFRRSGWPGNVILGLVSNLQILA